MSFSSDQYLHYLHRYVLPVFYVFGNLGNVFNIFIFTKKSWRKNVCVFYFNICLFINTCYINSIMLEDLLSSYDIDLYDSNISICKLYYYVVYLFSTLLPTVLILASIDRLLISSQNVDTRLYSSKRLAHFSVSFCSLFWFVFYFHLLIKVNLQEIYPTIFVCGYDASQFYTYFVSYSSLLINCLFCLIMIILSMFAFKNVHRIRALPRQQQRQQVRTMNKKDFQLLRCLFVQDIVYIIFSIPLSVFTVYQTATMRQTRTSYEQMIVSIFEHTTLFIHHIPYCASFYIFISVSKAFRNELKRLIYKMYCKELVPIHEEENKEQNISVVNHIVS